MDGDDRDGLALLPGTDFQDGVIEADIRAEDNDATRYPLSGLCPDAFHRRARCIALRAVLLEAGKLGGPRSGHAQPCHPVVSEPGLGWYRLHQEWPWVYESHAELAKETWTKVRIELAGRAAKLYVNGSAKPSLVVDGLKGEDLHGAVGLWAFTWRRHIFQRADYAGRAAELEKRFRCRRFVGNAVFQRCGRDGRADEVTTRWKQSDRNMVRPVGRRSCDNRHLAERLRGTLVRG